MQAGQSGRMSLMQLLRDQRYHRPTLLAAGVCVFQQFSGINTIIFFSVDIFASCGLKSAVLATVLVGATNFVVTLMSASLVDHYGRKMLWIGSHAGCGASLAVLALTVAWKGGPRAFAVTARKLLRVCRHGAWWPHTLEMFRMTSQCARPHQSYACAISSVPADDWLCAGVTAAAPVCVVCMLTFISFFAIGAGPVTWIYVGEVLPPEIKGIAGSLATAANWGSNSCIAAFFPAAVSQFGLAPVYCAFAVFNALAVWFGSALMLETKQLHLHLIHARLLTSE
jgi:MFS family permease